MIGDVRRGRSGEILVVTWDGSHAGHDEDLLVEALRVANKRIGTKSAKAKARNNAAELVYYALSLTPEPLTLRQLAARIGITQHAANNGLYKLRRRGWLGARDVQGTKSSWSGRPIKEYWLRTDRVTAAGGQEGKL